MKLHDFVEQQHFLADADGKAQRGVVGRVLGGDRDGLFELNELLDFEVFHRWIILHGGGAGCDAKVMMFNAEARRPAENAERRRNQWLAMTAAMRPVRPWSRRWEKKSAGVSTVQRELVSRRATPADWSWETRMAWRSMWGLALGGAEDHGGVAGFFELLGDFVTDFEAAGADAGADGGEEFVGGGGGAGGFVHGAEGLGDDVADDAAPAGVGGGNDAAVVAGEGGRRSSRRRGW